MAAKWHARIVRDIANVIVMTDGTQHAIPTPAGTVTVHRTRQARDAYIAAINADHPRAAEPA